MKNSPARPKLQLDYTWLALWIIFYSLIIIFGGLTPNSFLLTVIKIGSIFLCLAYARLKFPNDKLLQTALLVTLLADVILAMNNLSEFGVLTFLVAQIVHTLRLNSPAVKNPLGIYICLSAIVIVITIIIDYSFVTPVIAGCYFILLLANTFSAYRWFRRDQSNFRAWCAATGFGLYVCCDIWVAISFLALNHLFPGDLYLTANYLAWIFYFPAQVLIAHSSKQIATK